MGIPSTTPISDLQIVTPSELNDQLEQESLEASYFGQIIDIALEATGGSGTYTSWQIISGEAPPDLALIKNGNNGKIIGTHMEDESYDWIFTIEVIDSESNTASKEFTLTL